MMTGKKWFFCLCNRSSWLKSKAFNISILLNRLGVILDEKGRADPKELTPNGLQMLNGILDIIRIVSYSSDLTIRNSSYES